MYLLTYLLGLCGTGEDVKPDTDAESGLSTARGVWDTWNWQVLVQPYCKICVN